MTLRPYIVNTGIITAIGNNTEQCKDALMSGKNPIGKPDHLKTHWSTEIPVAEIKLSNRALADIAGVSEEWPRTALLSAVAVKEAWLPYREAAKGLRTGFFSANTVGGMDL